MNVQETKFTLKYLPPRQSVMLQGPHGIGKSDVVRQVAKELSIEDKVTYELIDIRLSQKEVGDLIGMPSAVDKFTVTHEVYKDGKVASVDVVANNVTVYAIPTWFPIDPNSRGILFCDELNRATREVQQVAFELVLDYRLNFRELPIGWRVVSAINNDTDIYAVLEIDPALMDRFLIVNFQPTTEEWLQYARENKVHDAVIKYITKFETNLEVPEKVEPGKVYPSRRSWVKFSTVMNHMAEKGQDLLAPERDKYLIKLASGFVGSTVAVHFEDFIKKDYKVLSAEDILNKYSDKLSKEIKIKDLAEIGYLNKLITEYTKKNILNKKQQDNLFRYYKDVLKEGASDLWNGLIRECKAETVKWWHGNPEIAKYTSSVLGKATALGI